MKKHRENILLTDKLTKFTFTFLRSSIIVGIARLKTAGRKSCPKVNEYSLQESFSKGKMKAIC